MDVYGPKALYASPQGLLLICASAWLLKGFLSWCFRLFTAFRNFGDCPGRFTLFAHPFGPLAVLSGSLLPRSTRFGGWYAGFSPYLEYGSTCLSSVVLWSAKSVLWIGDADTLRMVCTDKISFAKDENGYEPLNIFGRNIVSAEGSEWRRHRTVARRAFNDANNALVWQQTIRVLSEWFSQIETPSTISQPAEVEIDLLKNMTKATLLVLCSASFGVQMSWTDDQRSERGGQRSFQSTVITAAHFFIPRLAMPPWLLRWTRRVYIPIVTPYVQSVRVLFDDLKTDILDLISGARESASGGKDAQMGAALLHNLVDATTVQDEDHAIRRLSDNEVVADLFVFLIAGHETSAHTLCFIFMILALYPDIQQKLFEEVKTLSMEYGENLTYKDHLPKLVYTSAVFHETLRHFPIAPRLGRVAVADTVLKAHRFTENGEAAESLVPVKKGTYVLFNSSAVHMNPIHWGSDVQEFKPERFIDTETYRWPRDAFVPFITGYRSCIGERFAITEVMCMLAHVIRRYEVLLPVDLRGKPLEEQKQRLLTWTPGPTVTPTNAKVMFRRRK